MEGDGEPDAKRQGSAITGGLGQRELTDLDRDGPASSTLWSSQLAAIALKATCRVDCDTPSYSFPRKARCWREVKSGTKVERLRRHGGRRRTSVH